MALESPAMRLSGGVSAPAMPTAKYGCRAAISSALPQAQFFFGKWIPKRIWEIATCHKAKFSLRELERYESHNRLAAARNYDVFTSLDASEKFGKSRLGILNIELLGHVDQV
jgi:hypothetical protein